MTVEKTTTISDLVVDSVKALSEVNAQIKSAQLIGKRQIEVRTSEIPLRALYHLLCELNGYLTVLREDDYDDSIYLVVSWGKRAESQPPPKEEPWSPL